MSPLKVLVKEYSRYFCIGSFTSLILTAVTRQIGHVAEGDHCTQGDSTWNRFTLRRLTEVWVVGARVLSSDLRGQRSHLVDVAVWSRTIQFTRKKQMISITSFGSVSPVPLLQTYNRQDTIH